MTRTPVRQSVRVEVLLIPLTVGLAVPALLWLLLDSVPSAPLGLFGWLRLGVAAPVAALGGWLVADSVGRVYLQQHTPLGDKPPEELVQNGSYRLIRNPMTVGMVSFIMAVALATSAEYVAIWAVFVLILSSVTTVKIEEPSLHEKFGEEYREYTERVGRWIPRRDSLS